MVDCRPSVHRHMTTNRQAADRLKLTLVCWRKLILKLSISSSFTLINKYELSRWRFYDRPTALLQFNDNRRQSADRIFGQSFFNFADLTTSHHHSKYQYHHSLSTIYGCYSRKTGISALGSSRRIHKDPGIFRSALNFSSHLPMNFMAVYW